jgi:hypothetical protein
MTLLGGGAATLLLMLGSVWVTSFYGSLFIDSPPSSRPQSAKNETSTSKSVAFRVLIA